MRFCHVLYLGVPNHDAFGASATSEKRRPCVFGACTLCSSSLSLACPISDLRRVADPGQGLDGAVARGLGPLVRQHSHVPKLLQAQRCVAEATQAVPVVLGITHMSHPPHDPHTPTRLHSSCVSHLPKVQTNLGATSPTIAVSPSHP